MEELVMMTGFIYLVVVTVVCLYTTFRIGRIMFYGPNWDAKNPWPWQWPEKEKKKE